MGVGGRPWLDALISLLLSGLLAAACSGSTTTPTVSPSATPAVTGLTEEEFRALLTLKDVTELLGAAVPLRAELFDYKEIARSSEPGKVPLMDSWYGLVLRTEDGARGITLSVVDYKDPATAPDPLKAMESLHPGVRRMAHPLEELSAEVEVNDRGLGSIVAFVQGDKAVQLHTAHPTGEEPLLPLQALEELAQRVARRLE